MGACVEFYLGPWGPGAVATEDVFSLPPPQQQPARPQLRLLDSSYVPFRAYPCRRCTGFHLLPYLLTCAGLFLLFVFKRKQPSSSPSTALPSSSLHRCF